MNFLIFLVLATAATVVVIAVSLFIIVLAGAVWVIIREAFKFGMELCENLSKKD